MTGLHYKGFSSFLAPAADADDGVQLEDGAEAEHVSVGAEGAGRPGAGAGGHEPAVSVPAGHLPAAVLTCHSSRFLLLSDTDTQTAPAGPQSTSRWAVVLS